MRYFEDFQPGETSEAGPYVISREEIIAFAKQFDPQPFHLSDEGGREGIFGGIIASGWHTASICHKLVVEHLLKGSASLGSPGLDELRWLRPVRPGDALTARFEVVSTTPSRSKADRGAIKFRFEVRNQSGEVVMTEIANALFSRRPEGTEAK
ncbi:MaoC domain-containing protein [Myxococcus stipitatus DSM 14675]|uniref:MaoC domain-containing protein n=1 Tax=Myxococcus stipitatus (strain DSM 14675 / JCM 12634 / Mx s8) TaxID=1278073 RepID=L7U731_MYXSD|nr:MaoC family dehydratase [Myxococcus stipitatus]AGC43650.1 MaoC domain-containing protein [Myxococcus stipitatus DSM 14675]